MNFEQEQLIHNVATQFQLATGIHAYIDLDPPPHGAHGIIILERDERKRRMWFDVKRHLTRERLLLWTTQVRQTQEEIIIVTEYVPPALADQMKQMGVMFMDLAGNAYVDLPGLFVFLTGNKAFDTKHPAERAFAFKPAGLRVQFALLCNHDLAGGTYREIARAARVALGTVNAVLDDLVNRGFLFEAAHKTRHLRNIRDLFNDWVAVYPRILRPKVFVGRYACQNYEWWNEPTPGVEGAFWGGEIAAAMLTKYLKPATATVYVHEHLNEFLLRHGLRKDPRGRVEILKVFWDIKNTGETRNVVHPLLVYADLLATGDPRNLETAKILYDEQLARYFGQS